MAAAIEEATGQPVEIAPGNRGEFTVWVGDERVARKTTAGFPEIDEAVAAVAAALA